MPIQESLFRKVFDASSLINLKNNKKMNFLRKRKGEILIPEKVADELKRGSRNDPLHKYVNKYPEVVVNFQNSEEDEYLIIRRQIGIGDGEAAAITIAVQRDLPLVIDDIKGREKAKNHKIKTMSWQDFVTKEVGI